MDIEYNNIYGVNVINDEKAGILGSCIDYNTRKNITQLVRTEEYSLLLSLKEVEER